MSDAGIVSLESGRAFYRASAIALPPRCLAAGRLGYEQMPPPKGLHAAFQAGHNWESSVIRRTASSLGMKVVEDGAQDEIIIEIGTRAAIRGHIDGVLEDESGKRYGLEVKALGEDWFNVIKTKGIAGIAHYCQQLSCYMRGTGIDEWFFSCQPKAQPWDEPYIIRVDTPPCDIKPIMAKVALVEAMVRAGKELDDFAFESHGSGWCSFAYLHPDKEESDTPIEPDAVLDILAQTYRDVCDEEKVAKSKKDDLRVRLIEAMGQREKAATERWEIGMKVVTSRRVDMKLLTEKLGVDVVEQYKVDSSSTRISVKERD